MEKLLKVSEVSNLLNIGKATLYRLLREGKIDSIKIGSSIRISQNSLEDLMHSQKDCNDIKN